MTSPYTLAHQLKLAHDALGEARNHFRAKYYTTSMSNAYHAAHRAAAGLLYGLNLDPKTEREVRIAFAAAFIPKHTHERFNRLLIDLEHMRQRSEFDYDYEATPEEAQRALALATEFCAEAERLQKEVLK